jgi:hypothetical protein
MSQANGRFGSTTAVRSRPANGGYRRVSPVAQRRREGPLTALTAGTQL